MSTDPGFDPEIFSVFLEESAESLAELDAGLIEMEDDPAKRESLDAVFRAMHSLKGNSAFFGLTRLKTLAHHMEDMLGLMREGNLAVSRRGIEALLVGTDEIRHMLVRVRGGEPELPASAEEAYEAAMRQVDAACVEEGGHDPAALALAAIDKALAHEDADADELRAVLRSVRSHLHGEDGGATPEGTAMAAPTPAVEAASEAALALDGTAAALAPPPAGSMAPVAPPLADEASAVPQSTPHAESRSMRVDEAKIDQFLDYVGELIVLREMLNNVGKRVRMYSELGALASEFQRAMEAFTELSHELQTSIMEVRKVPVKATLRKVPRIVRDLSVSRGKEVRVRLEGEEERVDKSMLEAMESPLTHMVRNAADHGIESPQEREAAGKPREGTIVVSVLEEAHNVRVDIRDDGKGIDDVALRAKAVRNGLLTQAAAAALGQDEACQLLFAPGLSTAKEVTDISGRGVGMDVVKRSVVKLGGDIQISTERGKGTTFSIVIPKTVTVQIFDGFLVRVGAERFVLPLGAIRESFRPEASQLVSVAERGEFLQRRGAVLPLVRVNELLRLGGGRRLASEAIIVSVELADTGGCAGLLVDEVLGVQQVVLRDVYGIEADDAPFSGGAVLGDGLVAMVVDVERLGTLLSGRVASAAGLQEAAAVA